MTTDEKGGNRIEKRVRDILSRPSGGFLCSDLGEGTSSVSWK